MTDLQGKPFGEERRLRAHWKGLQSHASFPKGQTDIRAEVCKTPAGAFDCWRYEVRSKSGGKREIKRLWFAKKLPGPPVCFERWVGGKLVFRMVLVSKGRSQPWVRPVRSARPALPTRPARHVPSPRPRRSAPPAR